MSGGSFDYTCYRVMQFADELRNKLQEQGKDPSGEGWPNPTWTIDVACKLAEISAFADYVGALMKEAEWLYSGDTGEETFAERIRKIEATRGVMRLDRMPSNAELCGWPSGQSERAPGYASAPNTEEDMDHLIDDRDRLKPCPFCGAEAEIITPEGMTAIAGDWQA